MVSSPSPQEWVEKAEGDAEAARILMQRFSAGIAHTVAFHAQQSAEEYLKAMLIQECIPFPRTHDMGRLIALAVAVRPELSTIRPAGSVLQPYAVEVRYPGNDPDRAECTIAMRQMEEVRLACRSVLGLQTN